MNVVNKQLSAYYGLISSKVQKIIQNNHLRKAMDWYESYIGVAEIKSIQQHVLKAEKEFVESAKVRRNIQDNLLKLQDELKQIRHKLDSMSRSDEAYLELITNEHKLMKNEINLLNSMRSQETLERELFTSFSQRLREAHEFERLRQEKVKYLSVYGSVAGALVGIIGTSLNHTLKMRDINKLIVSHNNQLNDFLNSISSRLDGFDNLITTRLPNSTETTYSNSSSKPSENLEGSDIQQSLKDVNRKLEILPIQGAIFSVIFTITLVGLTYLLSSTR